MTAFSWPPENYEMPRAVLDAATAEESLSGLRDSAGAVANTGLVLIGIIVSVSLIATIFKRLFLDKLGGLGPGSPRAPSHRSRSSSPADGCIRERDLSSGGLRNTRRGRG